MLTRFGEVPDRLATHMSMAELDEWLHRPVRRRTMLKVGAAAAGGLAIGPTFLRSAAAAASPPSIGARRLSYGADPTTQMNVAFSMRGAGRALVRYGTSGDLDGRREAQITRVHGTPTRYGKVELTGLEPDTLYGYAVQSGAGLGVAGTFRTAPSEPRPFAFTAFADQGVTPAAVEAVSRIRSLRPTMHLVAGDLCYADQIGNGQLADPVVSSVWDEWLSLVEPISAQVPWMIAMGNHEMEPGFGPQGYDGVLARLSVPKNGPAQCPAAYSFVYGDVGFIALDSNDVSFEIPQNLGYTHGAQRRWLEQTLASWRGPSSPVDFVVVFFHHCGYSTNSAHGSEGGVRDQWTTLFDQYEVDLVLNGHNHCYERTMPIRGGQPVDVRGDIDSTSGTTYMTIGGGGRDVNPFFLDRTHETRLTYEPGHSELQPADWSVSHAGEHCFLHASVRPGNAGGLSSMDLTVYSVSDAAVIDKVTLNRPSSRSQTRTGTDNNGLWVPALSAAGGAAVLAGAAAVATRRVHRPSGGW